MNIQKTALKDVLIIEPMVYSDSRGWFSESYSNQQFLINGIDINFIQDNHSFSGQKGTLRGLHFQTNPKSQSKLIRCTRGKILDVVVDLRRGSDTYKKWVSIELSEDNKKQLLVPQGFAHGFLTLTENVEVQYKVDEYYSKENDMGIRFDDPEIGVEWGNQNPVLSDKDLNAPLLKDSEVDFSIKVLVTGVKGQLGYDVIKRLNELGIKNNGVDIDDFDITSKEETEKYITNYQPDVIIHCAAYTAVDKAEENKDKCNQINIKGTRNIAEVCKVIDAKLVYISTDYIFDGEGEEPHLEGKEANPVNYYGYSKEQGEKTVKELVDKYFIVRTSWLYGGNGDNFVKTMLKLAETKDELKIINDQIGAPTYTCDLALLICDMFQTTKYGIYHGVNEDYCSWYEFAVEIFKKANINIKLLPITTIEYPTKAKRPQNSRLSKEKLDENGFSRLPKWKDALDRFFDEL